MTPQVWGTIATGALSIIVQIWAASRTNAFFQGKVEQRFQQAEENITRIDDSKNQLWAKVMEHEGDISYLQGRAKPNGELH